MTKEADVGDEKQVEKRKTKKKLAREREIEGFRQVLDTYVGREFIWRAIAECGIYRAPPTHPQETFRAIGQQDIGRWLQTEVFTADGDAYKLMWEEAEERERELERKDNG